MSKRLLLIILLLAILPTALAEFTIDAQPEIKESCPTEINLFTIPVTNTLSKIATYTVSLSGSAAKWAVAAPPGFVLQPGETQTVFVYATPFRDARIGNYALTININDGKTSKSITETIIIKECFGVSLLTAEAEKTICSCEESNFLFKLENTGEFTENYELNLAGSASKWATLSEQFVRLLPKESRDIAVHIAPGCENIGVYGLTLTVKSETSEAISSANIGLAIQGCYDFNAYPEQNYYSFCENSEIKVPITIENKGSSEDAYSLSTTGPSWIALDKKELTINGGGGASINLIAFPTYGISGNYPVKIYVTSQKGRQEKTADLNLNVLTCYSTAINLDAMSDSLCPGTESQHKVILTNAGNFAETYALTVSGADWASLSQSSVALATSENKNIDLILSPKINAIAGKQNIIITAKAQGTSGTSDSVTISVEILPNEQCFGVDITPQIKKTEVEYGGSSLVSLTVKNLGVEKTIYTLDVSGNGASYAQLNPAVVEIEGGKSEETYLYISVPDKTAIGRYSLVVSARDEAGVVSSSSEITFDIVEKVANKPSAGINENITWRDKLRSRIDSFASAGFSLIKNKTISAFSAVKNKTKQIPYVASSYAYLKERWYLSIAIIVVIVLMIAGVIAKLTSKREGGEFIDDFYEKPEIVRRKASGVVRKGLWQRFKDWVNAEDLEEFEVGWDVEKKPKLKEKKEKKKEGLWKKFMDWFEEEPLKRKPIGKSKKGKSAWQRFIDWLEDTSEQAPRASTERGGVPEKEKPKKALKKKGKSAWDRFTDWLNAKEEDLFKPEPEEEEPVKRKALNVERKKGKGLWDKFLDWLEEEEEPKKVRGRELRVRRKKKEKRVWKKFSKWLEEE